MILGEPGSGKTVLANQLLLGLITQQPTSLRALLENISEYQSG